MVSYNEQVPKMRFQSSTVVIDHHINIWLSKDCGTLTIAKSKARCKDFRTEGAAMLSVVRAAFLCFLQHCGASDGRAANLAVLVGDQKERWHQRFSGTKSFRYKVRVILGNTTCTYILLLMWSKWWSLLPQKKCNTG